MVLTFMQLGVKLWSSKLGLLRNVTFYRSGRNTRDSLDYDFLLGAYTGSHNFCGWRTNPRFAQKQNSHQISFENFFV